MAPPTRRTPRVGSEGFAKIAELATQQPHSTSVPCSTMYPADFIDEADARLEGIALVLSAGAWNDGIDRATCLSLLSLVDRVHRLVDLAVAR